MENQRDIEIARYVTKAAIAFDTLPCGQGAAEASRVLRSLEGIMQIFFDPCVRRATVSFDPEKVDLPLILSTLGTFGPNPRVLSVTIPVREV